MVGQLIFSSFSDIASEERLRHWYSYQGNAAKPINYLLPSMRWFQSARKKQAGISFQTFDDLAVQMLEHANIEFTPISEEDRVFFFYELLDTMLTFYSEKELIQEAKAYADTYGQLKRLGLTVNQTPDQLTNLIPVFTAYEYEYRDNKGLFDPENRIYKAVESGETLSSFPLSHVVIDGYLDFSPVQYKLIEYLVTSSIPVTIYLPDFDTPLLQETITTLEKIGFDSPNFQDQGQSTSSVLCKKKDRTSATTVEEEIHGVLETIYELKENNRFDQFGLVLVNEEKYLPELVRISNAKQIPMKKALQKQLSETKIFGLLQLILQKFDSTTSKWEQIPLIDSVAKLCYLSPNNFNDLKEQFISNQEICVSEVRFIVEDITDLQKSLQPKQTIASYNEQLLHLLEKISFPTIWKKMIKEKATKQLHQVALEIRAFNRIKEILEQVQDNEQQLPVHNISVHLETYETWIIDKLHGESIYMDRAPADGIEIYSFRDVPLFKGKHLFVLGLNEGEFPKQIKLGGYFQERYIDNQTSRFPLPTSSYFRLKDDALFAQLQYVAERLSFSYVEGMNPNQPMLPSKYLMDPTIIVNSISYATISRLKSNTYQTNQELEEKLAYHTGLGKEVTNEPSKLIQYKHNLAYLRKGKEVLSSKWLDKFLAKNISITKLERYALCSFKFGLENVLKIKPPLEKQTKVDPIETGNMLHHIIELFYKEVKGLPFKEIAAFYAGQAEQKLEALFEKEWDEIVQKHHELSRRVLQKEKEEWWKKLRRWLAAEKYRFWENEQLADMTIFRIEEPIQLNITLPNNETVTLTGKIDRIDMDEHGFVIYDYKSSTKTLNFEQDIPTGQQLQIPLYMMALEHEFTAGRYKGQTMTNTTALGGGYISIKEPKLRKKNTVWKDEMQKLRFEPSKNQTNIEELTHEALTQIYKIPETIDKIWRGTASDFSINPISAAACTYCSYKNVCRVTPELQNAYEGAGTDDF